MIDNMLYTFEYIVYDVSGFATSKSENESESESGGGAWWKAASCTGW